MCSAKIVIIIGKKAHRKENVQIHIDCPMRLIVLCPHAAYHHGAAACHVFLPCVTTWWMCDEGAYCGRLHRDDVLFGLARMCTVTRTAVCLAALVRTVVTVLLTLFVRLRLCAVSVAMTVRASYLRGYYLTGQSMRPLALNFRRIGLRSLTLAVGMRAVGGLAFHLTGLGSSRCSCGGLGVFGSRTSGLAGRSGASC